MSTRSSFRGPLVLSRFRDRSGPLLLGLALSVSGVSPAAAPAPAPLQPPTQVFILERPADSKYPSLPLGQADAIRKLGADRVEDYGPFLYVSTKTSIPIEKLEAATSLQAHIDPFAFLVDVGGRFRDIRDPWPPDGADSSLVMTDYPSGKTGLYIIKLAMPAKTTWFDTAKAAKWRLLQYLHANAWIIAAPAGLQTLAEQSRSEAVHIEPLQPWDKLQGFLRTDQNSERRAVTMLFDGGQDAPEFRKAIRGIDADAVVSIDNRGEGSADLLATSAEARLLARRSEVIGIQIRSHGGPSSEREAQIAVGHHSNNLPTDAGYYRSWLSGLCGGCLSPAALATEKVAVFDTGLSETTGIPGQIAHPDLDGAGNGARLAYPSAGCCGFQNANTNDTSYHGTVVTGLIAGDPQQTKVPPQVPVPADVNGFYWGTGVAPGVKFGMTRMMTHIGFANSISASNLAEGMLRVFDLGARYQNSSWNFRPDAPMQAPPDDPSYGYDAVARRFDILVRDARALDSNSPQAENPMAIVVSVGNIAAGDNLYQYVRSPATAKNVISVGATGLAVWEYVSAVPCRTAIGIRDVSTLSRRGTPFLAYGTAYLRLLSAATAI